MKWLDFIKKSTPEIKGKIAKRVEKKTKDKKRIHHEEIEHDDYLKKRLSKYFDEFGNVKIRSFFEDIKKLNALERLIKREYLTLPEDVPHAYVNRRMEITGKSESEIRLKVFKDQVESLMPWIEYLNITKHEGKIPLNANFKFFVLKSILKMDARFGNRQKHSRNSEKSISPFPFFDKDYTPAILLYLETFIDGYLKNPLKFADTNIDQDLYLAVKEGNFKSMYQAAMNFLEDLVAIKESKESFGGFWKKYSLINTSRQLSDPEVQDIINDATRLCQKANYFCTNKKEKTIEYLLENSEDIEFYTVNIKTEDNKIIKVPRIAIITNGVRVVELRGDTVGEFIDPEYLPVLLEKAKTDKMFAEFLESIKPQIETAKRVLEIREKVDEYEKGNGPDLSVEDLYFLYYDAEIRKNAIGFYDGRYKNEGLSASNIFMSEIIKRIKLKRINKKYYSLVYTRKSMLNSESLDSVYELELLTSLESRDKSILKDYLE